MQKTLFGEEESFPDDKLDKIEIKRDKPQEVKPKSPIEMLAYVSEEFNHSSTIITSVKTMELIKNLIADSTFIKKIKDALKFGVETPEQTKIIDNAIRKEMELMSKESTLKTSLLRYQIQREAVLREREKK